MPAWQRGRPAAVQRRRGCCSCRGSGIDARGRRPAGMLAALAARTIVRRSRRRVEIVAGSRAAVIGAQSPRTAPHGTDRSQVRRHVDGSTERIRSVAKRVAKWARRAPDGGRALGHERRDQPPARAGQRTAPRPTNAGLAARARPDRRHRRAGVGRPAGAGAAGRRPGRRSATTGWQVPVAPTAPSPRRASSRSTTLACAPTWPPGGGRHHRLPGHRRRTATSPRWAAAARTPRRWPWPRR